MFLKIIKIIVWNKYITKIYFLNWFLYLNLFVTSFFSSRHLSIPVSIVSWLFFVSQLARSWFDYRSRYLARYFGDPGIMGRRLTRMMLAHLLPQSSCIGGVCETHMHVCTHTYIRLVLTLRSGSTHVPIRSVRSWIWYRKIQFAVDVIISKYVHSFISCFIVFKTDVKSFFMLDKARMKFLLIL